MSELTEVEVTNLEELEGALGEGLHSGAPFVLTEDGQKVAVVVPYDTVVSLVQALTPMFKVTIRAVAQVFGVPL